jgi:hypothetical protein
MQEKMRKGWSEKGTTVLGATKCFMLYQVTHVKNRIPMARNQACPDALKVHGIDKRGLSIAISGGEPSTRGHWDRFRGGSCQHILG